MPSPGIPTPSQGCGAAAALARLKVIKRQLIERHVRPDHFKGLSASAATLLLLAALTCAAWRSTELSYALTAAITLLTGLFLLRAFVLMHECGHGSLFRSGRLNRGFGFVFGVLCGMPQFVWSQHHQFHHAHNGNWDRYRGPLNTAPVAEYAAMSVDQRRRYRRARSIWLAPLAGFMYVIVHPRLTWLRGSAGLLRHVLAGKRADRRASIGALAAAYRTPCWQSLQQWQHMTCNNLALLALWGLLLWGVGPLLFVGFYLVSVSLAGGAGLLLFAVQHNFEQSYASSDEGWDYTRGAIEGTSFLHLPGWLNWFTANIAYHHIHHLSARIPSYCLAACHDEYAMHFSGVTRIRLAQVPAALKYILWDTLSQRIVSVAELQRQQA
jgi:acyl-lipid omega-6 desaturase (Delta-12 desaturase)